MKVCTCGHVFEDGEQFCPDCGNNVNEVPDSVEVTSTPISFMGVEDKPKKAEAKPEAAESEPFKKVEQPAVSGGTPDAPSIFSIFEGDKSHAGSDEKKPAIKKPEKPKPGPNVEVKPMANATKEAKFDPMKTQPPMESRYSLLQTGSTVLRVFFLLIPVVGLIYAIILTMSGKKDNVRTLGTAFLSAYMLQIVIIAAAMLIFALLYQDTFDKFIEIMEYALRTIFEGLKSM